MRVVRKLAAVWVVAYAAATAVKVGTRWLNACADCDPFDIWGDS
jgi:hypothetical protein